MPNSAEHKARSDAEWYRLTGQFSLAMNELLDACVVMDGKRKFRIRPPYSPNGFHCLIRGLSSIEIRISKDQDYEAELLQGTNAYHVLQSGESITGLEKRAWRPSFARSTALCRYPISHSQHHSRGNLHTLTIIAGFAYIPNSKLENKMVNLTLTHKEAVRRGNADAASPAVLQATCTTAFATYSVLAEAAAVRQ